MGFTGITKQIPFLQGSRGAYTILRIDGLYEEKGEEKVQIKMEIFEEETLMSDRYIV